MIRAGDTNKQGVCPLKFLQEMWTTTPIFINFFLSWPLGQNPNLWNTKSSSVKILEYSYRKWILININILERLFLLTKMRSGVYFLKNNFALFGFAHYVLTIPLIIERSYTCRNAILLIKWRESFTPDEQISCLAEDLQETPYWGHQFSKSWYLYISVKFSRFFFVILIRNEYLRFLRP